MSLFILKCRLFILYFVPFNSLYQCNFTILLCKYYLSGGSHASDLWSNVSIMTLFINMFFSIVITFCFALFWSNKLI